ncbi:MAG TPA: Glu/Leu/Phe/Val dehydrogenase [Pyrinomonadaceae bacterium]|nr:Glu/Leu/Phe/Val dehydrogenase [Pyrinomonadaceae bacterium]
MRITELGAGGHERVALCEDEGAGYRAVVAVHSTALGPALGGTRLWNYPSVEEAITDALRLSRGMTYKNALAGLPFGGGKSVVVADARTVDRERLFRAHGRFVETFNGIYVTAEDVGTTPADMELVARETCHVAGLSSRSGDPSPHTAHGVFRAMQAAAKFRWGTDSLAGRAVAVQGCGNVGRNLARELRAAGARLFVSDVDEARARRAAQELGASVVAAGEIYDAAADVFAPCALGGVINDETIPRLHAEIVCGAANNQLLEARHGDALHARAILYAPDYAANAGGVINGCRELLGWTAEQSAQKVHSLYDTLLDILRLARDENMPTHAAADRLAEARLGEAKAQRRAT